MEREEKEKLAGLFARFWEVYPRHEAKQNAWKEFQKLNPDDELVSVMIPWIGLARESEQWQKEDKIPFASTWLHQKRWQDDPPPKPDNSGGSHGGDSYGQERRDRKAADRCWIQGPAYVVTGGKSD